MHLFIDALALQPCTPTFIIDSRANFLGDRFDISIRWCLLWPSLLRFYSMSRGLEVGT
ncbi:hypothetical protein BKA62DRAFT_730631 [Auriculariales sp. MPI-PUGE-AT-0066]|nr:hypothetical protein BKA62DRAFT_730631 [Auriculariales sp. MPI-PUGE-AT-0066]